MMKPDALLLYPGAGSDCAHHTLVVLEDHLAPLPVHRRDFPYRAQRRGPPDRAPKLIEAITTEAGVLAAGGVEGLVAGGRSMGGRMCSMAVAAGLRATGLVLLSYPLHPPGRPERSRVEHFGGLDVPCLFISGTKDPFATPEELGDAVRAIPGPVTLAWLEGQRHDPKRCDRTIAAIVADWLGGL